MTSKYSPELIDYSPQPHTIMAQVKYVNARQDVNGKIILDEQSRLLVELIAVYYKGRAFYIDPLTEQIVAILRRPAAD